MIIFINNGNYSHRFEKYEIILRKKTSNVTIIKKKIKNT